MEFIVELLGIIADFLLFAEYKKTKTKRLVEIVILTLCFIALITVFINLAVAASSANYIAGLALYAIVLGFVVVYLIILYDLIARKRWS